LSQKKTDADNPDQDVSTVANTGYSIFTGVPPEERDTMFYILGLSLNKARISVRFWHTGRIGDFARKISQHFEDLELEGGNADERKRSLAYLLRSIALERKQERIAPNLAGNMVKAILTGQPYPVPVLHQAIRRIRAEQKKYHIRAALLKAYLNRKNRSTEHTREKEITVGLDRENRNVGYRLGRLFATLEKIQEDASGGRTLNTTIRERYYSAASSSPVTVFPQLLKLKNHHLAKIESPAFKVMHEKRLTEIMGELPPSLPAHMKMEDQARFAIGYYHQRQDFFRKSTHNEGETHE
jgi:CRISPR-associated protein Csd1